jgi:protoporphyrinogen oxidase
MNTQRVAVVGAGLAGLTAAYRLLKEGQCSVDIYEAEPVVGGRVQSRSVLGVDVDFGGFLIYPWYEHALALFADLEVTEALTKTPLDDIYYILDDTGVALREDAIPFPVADGLKIWSKSLFKILPKSDLSTPNLERFEGKTISAYLRTILGDDTTPSLYETFFDTVNQGYCYGPVTQSKAAFMMPIVRQVKFHGDIRTTSYLRDGGHVLTDCLLQEIATMGGAVHTNTPITDVKGTTLFSGEQSFTHDAVVFAQTVSPELYRTILPDIEPACSYTRFVTVAVQLPHAPIVGNTKQWGALFFAPHNDTAPQTLSIINLPSLYGETLKNCVMMNIVLHGNEPEDMTNIRVTKIVHAEMPKRFPDCADVAVLEFVHWKRTMPIAQEAFVQAIRDAQGKNGYFFAGDFLGAPSIETAIATGNHAAANVLVKTQTS